MAKRLVQKKVWPKLLLMTCATESGEGPLGLVMTASFLGVEGWALQKGQH